MFKSIIAIAALVACSGAWSAPFDSNWLYEKCEELDGEPSVVCISHYAATVNTATIMTAYFEEDPLYCTPENFNLGIGIKIWRRHLDENPAQLTQPANLTIILSLQEAYPGPCED